MNAHSLTLLVDTLVKEADCVFETNRPDLS